MMGEVLYGSVWCGFSGVVALCDIALGVVGSGTNFMVWKGELM